jgi:hypothetical protein
MKIYQVLSATLFAALSLAGQVPDFTPQTPLMGAILHNDTAEVKRLLASGADPNEGRFIGAPPIFLAFLQQNPEILRAMIDKGADIKATDRIGSTTLMWAAANETANPEIVNELLKRGVDPNAKNKSGDTALSWALRRGYTPVVDALKKSGASDSALIKQSVEKAIALLQKSGPEFVKVSGCSSCHHQSLPQMAYGAARERGFQVNADISQQQTKAVMAMFKPIREMMLEGKDQVPDPAITVSYAMIGLSAEGYAPDETTAAMAYLVSAHQTADGSFRGLAGRPPMESSVFSATALSIRALQVYGKEPHEKIRRAAEWLRTAKPRTTEERTMQLLGLAWAKAKSADLLAFTKALVAEQQKDGGWAQLPALGSDAYATGQALVALQASGQLDVNDPVYQRGVAFLLRTQREDGSWFVQSRSVPLQPYKESGFPHGKDQWISAAGTSWAVMALSVTAPKPQQEISKAF